jgi:hypothetical protein
MRMLSYCRQLFRGQDAIILMMRCPIRSKKGLIINIGLTNTESKMLNLEKEALKTLIQGHTDLFLLPLAHLIE